MTTTKLADVVESTAIRPFQVNVPEADLDRHAPAHHRHALARRRRRSPTRRRACRSSHSRTLAHYWATDYDWRKCEAKLNALPQFITEIDGLDIHFIHVRSKHKGALPVIVTHGWPGSIHRADQAHRPADQPHGLQAAARRTPSTS